MVSVVNYSTSTAVNHTMPPPCIQSKHVVQCSVNAPTSWPFRLFNVCLSVHPTVCLSVCVCVLCSVVQCRRVIYVVRPPTVVRQSPVVCAGIVVRHVASLSVTEASFVLMISRRRVISQTQSHRPTFTSVVQRNFHLLTAVSSNHLPVLTSVNPDPNVTVLTRVDSNANPITVTSDALSVHTSHCPTDH